VLLRGRYRSGIGESYTPRPGNVTRTLAAVTALTIAAASSAGAQQPDSLPGPRPRWVHAAAFRIEVPAAFAGAGSLALPRRAPGLLAQAWADSLAARLAARQERRWAAALTGDTALLRVPRPQLVLLPQAPPTTGRPGALLGQVSDLGLELNALFEMRFDRLRNLRCTAADAGALGGGCRAGFTPPRIEPQFSVRTGGVVGQRIHVNVDYDTEREFDASNNIQVRYQGLEDEILRSVQFGNVSFTVPGMRFVTGGIPVNNFGVQLEGQVGAVDFTAIYAQQRGNVVRDRVFSVGTTTVQPVSRELEDRDFEPARFFFIVDPATLPAYPAVDVMGLATQSLPAAVRVTRARVYRRRSTLNRAAAEQNLTGIEAVAIRPDSPQRAGPFAWELLIEGRDYYLDASGVWIALAARLDTDDYLAVSYVTAAGDTIGTFPATGEPGQVDTLRLISEPRRGAEQPTFRHEIRNAYRLGSSDDVTRESVELALRVAESERPAGGAATFLGLLGLALETDASRFDQYNRLFPRLRDPGQGSPLRDYFIIFPHLQPFADSARLAPEYRVDSLYRTPVYLLRTQGPTPLYRLSLQYDARGGEDRGTLALGGFQIREGSERISVSGRPLARNVHYTINYEIGQVRFTNPDSLFPGVTQVNVQYEENQAFAIAPTTVFGAHTRYDLGDHGSLSALGIFQRERTTFTRPPLGFEPSSNFVGGLAANLRFEPARLTRLLDGLPLIRTEAPSLLTFDAEFATSMPSPNQVGTAYVETFESEAGLFLPLDESAWGLGSRPSSARGLAGSGVDPVAGFLDQDAVALTWQNLVAHPLGGIAQFRSQDIDPAIRLQGTGQQSERVLFLGMHPDTVGGLSDPLTFAVRWLLPATPGPRWRSLSLPLSATGIDLTRMEFLEFWVLEDPARRARDAGTRVVFDFGTVYEDAVDFVPTGFTVSGRDTTYTGRRRIGEGRLDSERDSLTNTFNAAFNDTGILGAVADSIRDLTADSTLRNFPLCRSALAFGLVVYSWGSLQSQCSRRNGRVDSEDLNNDQRLDTLIAAAQENLVRFVFPMGDERYFVRDGGQAPGLGQWRLYRIPLRFDTLQIGIPDLRQIRAVRMTVVTPPLAAESLLVFALARMKLVGAPWVKRSGTPIAGLAGNRGEAHGEVIASVISTENRDDLGYESPPGVTDQGASRGGSLQIGAQQINERALRLIGTDVRPGERAEAFYRFPEGERNFLGYRQLRVWARGRGAGWDSRELSFFVKIGHDENNFYLYRTTAGTTTWLPEVVVDFNQWLALRASLEARYLRGEAPSGAAQCGGDTLAWVACSGPYVVHVRNPGVAPPNLTRVQELAVGFVRDSGLSTDSAELWINELRLTGVVDDAGYAGAVSLRLNAADVADVSLQLSRRDGNFRQLGEDPSYVTTDNVAIAAALRLEKLGLEPLGIAMPVSFRRDRSTRDPFYMNRTDVRAAELDGLRRPEQSTTSWSVQLRRTGRGTAWWQRALVDNVTLTGSWSSSTAATELTRVTGSASDVRGDYLLTPREVSFRYAPGFLREALEALPAFLRRAEFVQGLRAGRLRLTPASLHLSAGVTRVSAERFTFRAPIAIAGDTNPPTVTSSALLRNGLRLDMRPFGSMGLGFDYSEERDLRNYGDSTSIGVLAAQSRRRFLGMDIGFERSQRLATRFNWSPSFTSWLRPRLGWNSDFLMNRDPNAREVERSDGDSAGAFRLPSAFSTNRTTDLSAVLDLPRAMRGLFGDSTPLRRVMGIMLPVDISRRLDRRSQLDRPGFDPGFLTQIGWGGEGAFREPEGRAATSAVSAVQDRLGSGLRLPLGLSVAGAWSTRESNVWSRRATGQQLVQTREVDWPNLTARWLWTPPRRLRPVVASLTGSAGIRKRESTSEQPGLIAGEGGVAVRTSQLTRSSPRSVSITWGPRITTAMSWGDERTEVVRPGSQSRNERDQVAGDLTFSFRIPPDIVPLRSDIRTNLRFSESDSRTCVRRSGTPDCIPIADSRRTEYSFALDTDMPPNMTAGLSAGYVLTEERHVNRKFSQFTLTATFRLTLSAGGLR
jgi:hypothetical protein